MALQFVLSIENKTSKGGDRRSVFKRTYRFSDRPLVVIFQSCGSLVLVFKNLLRFYFCPLQDLRYALVKSLVDTTFDPESLYLFDLFSPNRDYILVAMFETDYVN